MADPVTGWMKMIGVVERVSRPVASQMKSHDVSQPQQRILLDIWDNRGTTDLEVRRRLAMPSSQISRAMRELIEKGWVQAAASINHQSQRCLSLTDAGSTQASIVYTLQREAFVNAFGMLEPTEQKVFEKAALSLLPPTSPVLRLSVIEPSHLAPLIHIILREAMHLNWNAPGQLYAVQRLITHFERWSSEYETGWMMTDGSRVAALCLMTPGRDFSRNAETDEHATITMLKVTKQYARMGYGRVLLDRCIREAREATYASLTMYLPADEQILIKMLKSRKFLRRNKPELSDRFAMYAGPRKWVHMDLNLNAR